MYYLFGNLQHYSWCWSLFHPASKRASEDSVKDALPLSVISLHSRAKDLNKYSDPNIFDAPWSFLLFHLHQNVKIAHRLLLRTFNPFHSCQHKLKCITWHKIVVDYSWWHCLSTFKQCIGPPVKQEQIVLSWLEPFAISTSAQSCVRNHLTIKDKTKTLSNRFRSP